jgi:hypothetical protein
LDYVVAGFGIGAILALVGFALWELFGNVEESGTGWLSRAAIGLMLGALVIWSVTGVTLISTIDDSTGSRLVFFTSLVTLVAVAAGTFWYWRADQAIAASIQQPPRLRSQRVTAAAPDDDELSEWDSWPERQERRSDEPTVAVAVVAAAAASFEPEVAAEAVEAPAEEEAAEDVVEPAVEPDEQPENEPDSDPDDRPEPETAAVAGEEDEVEAEPEPEPEEPLPSNIRPFRPPAPVVVQPAPTNEADESEDAVVSVDETAPAEPDPAEEPDEPAEPDPELPSDNRSGKPTAFESSLLADIDSGTAEGDGRYRSPLLADLVPDPNELEGVGLAKWRPEARLDTEDAEPPRKSRRK